MTDNYIVIGYILIVVVAFIVGFIIYAYRRMKKRRMFNKPPLSKSDQDWINKQFEEKEIKLKEVGTEMILLGSPVTCILNLQEETLTESEKKILDELLRSESTEGLSEEDLAWMKQVSKDNELIAKAADIFISGQSNSPGRYTTDTIHPSEEAISNVVQSVLESKKEKQSIEYIEDCREESKNLRLSQSEEESSIEEEIVESIEEISKGLPQQEDEDQLSEEEKSLMDGFYSSTGYQQ